MVGDERACAGCIKAGTLYCRNCDLYKHIESRATNKIESTTHKLKTCGLGRAQVGYLPWDGCRCFPSKRRCGKDYIGRPKKKRNPKWTTMEEFEFGV